MRIDWFVTQPNHSDLIVETTPGRRWKSPSWRWVPSTPVTWERVCWTSKPPQWKMALRWWARAMSSPILGKNILGDHPQLIQRKLNFSQQQGSERAAFIIDKQLHRLRESTGCVTVCPWVNQRNANICLPELARPVWGGIRSSAQRKSMKTAQGTNYYILYYTLNPPRG